MSFPEIHAFFESWVQAMCKNFFWSRRLRLLSSLVDDLRWHLHEQISIFTKRKPHESTRNLFFRWPQKSIKRRIEDQARKKRRRDWKKPSFASILEAAFYLICKKALFPKLRYSPGTKNKVDWVSVHSWEQNGFCLQCCYGALTTKWIKIYGFIAEVQCNVSWWILRCLLSLESW